MLKILILLPLLCLCACMSLTAPLAKGQSTDVSCIDSKDGCAAKALTACPRGYDITKEYPPAGTGIYYTDHRSFSAKEEMAYRMTVMCH